MKYLSEKNKKSKLVPVLITLVVLLSIAVAVLSWMLLQLTGADNAAQPPAETLMTETPGETTEALPQPEQQTQPQLQETVPVQAEDFRISTPCCDLYLPAEWEGVIRADTIEMDGMCAVTFLGVLEEREVPLYTLLFEKGENQGTALGSVQTEDGTAWIYLEMSELDQDKTLTAQQYDELMSMQETVNNLLEKLALEPAFAPGA